MFIKEERVIRQNALRAVAAYTCSLSGTFVFFMPYSLGANVGKYFTQPAWHGLGGGGAVEVDGYRLHTVVV